MSEVLKPSFNEPTKSSGNYTLDAIIITGDLDPHSKTARLDPDSSMKIFTGAVTQRAAVGNGLILTARTPEIADLMVDRLSESTTINDERPVSVVVGKKDNSDAQLVKAVRRKFPNLDRLGIIAPNRASAQKEFREAGIRLEEILPENVLSEQIAASAANSPRTMMDIALEIGEQFLRYKKLFMGGISLYKVAERSGSTA